MIRLRQTTSGDVIAGLALGTDPETGTRYVAIDTGRPLPRELPEVGNIPDTTRVQVVALVGDDWELLVPDPAYETTYRVIRNDGSSRSISSEGLPEDPAVHETMTIGTTDYVVTGVTRREGRDVTIVRVTIRPQEQVRRRRARR